MAEEQKLKRLKDKRKKGQTVIYKHYTENYGCITGSKFIHHYLFVS
jgi:type III secretory pathway component EscU